MSRARKTLPTAGPSAPAREEEIDDTLEVPAAVVCAACGRADCAGGHGEGSQSGVVSMVAWERPAVSVLARLWATARATTLAGDAFFERLPDGPVAPALRFALLAEVFAAAGAILITVPFVVALAPSWVSHVLHDPVARARVGRIGFLAVPGLALLLVGAHAAHGLALDRGARQQGGRSRRARALRFGLYASGWDLVLGPIGFVALGVTRGPRALLGLIEAGVTLPRTCTRAFLRGAYGLEGRAADAAGAVATRAAVAGTLVGAVLILIVAVVLALV